MLISTVVLEPVAVGIDVTFAVVTSLLFEAKKKVGFEKLVAVKGLVIPLLGNTGTDD